jgi:S1-C subfamily serine protease
MGISVVDVRVDTAALRSFVVRVRDAQGRVLGSGVLVASGLVLTCAHVVAGRDDVVLDGAGLPSSAGVVPLRVGRRW